MNNEPTPQDHEEARAIVTRVQKGASLNAEISAALYKREQAVWQAAADHVRDQWLAAYPLDVFPAPPPPPAECSRDSISAAMGRHMATKLIEEFERRNEGKTK